MDIKEFKIEGMPDVQPETAEAPKPETQTATQVVAVAKHKRGYAVTIDGETVVYPFLGTALKEVKEYFERK